MYLRQQQGIVLCAKLLSFIKYYQIYITKKILQIWVEIDKGGCEASGEDNKPSIDLRTFLSLFFALRLV